MSCRHNQVPHSRGRLNLGGPEGGVGRRTARDLVISICAILVWAVDEMRSSIVILTEFHESARIDRQLFGRCARQGNPGSFECLVSLEDELFQRFVPGFVRTLAATLIVKAGAAVRPRLGHVLRWLGQQKAERIHARTRRETVERDRRLEKALAFAGQSE